MKLVVSKQGYSRKPTEVIRDLQYTSLYKWVEADVRDIAEYVVNGHTIRVGYAPEPDYGEEYIFNRSKFEYAQMIILDFDTCGYTPWEVCEYAEKIGIPANFWYWSFSQNPQTITSACTDSSDHCIYIYSKQKPACMTTEQAEDIKYKPLYNFRLVWVLEKPVTVQTFHEIVAYLIHEAFAAYEPDPEPKSIASMFHGGSTSGAVLHEEPVPATHIEWTLLVKKIKEGRTSSQIVRAKLYQDYNDIEIPDSIEVTGDWWERLRGRCPIWDSFEDGTIRYHELVILLSHLRYLKYADTDKSVQKDLLKIYADAPQHLSTSLQADAQGEIYRKFRDTKLKPVFGIVQVGNRKVTIPDYFAHYKEDSFSVPTTSKVSLEELDEWMRTDLKEALLSKRNVIVQSQTGSGKTKAYLEVLADLNYFGTKVIVALPTYITMNEVYAKFKRLRPDVPCYKTEPIENLDEHAKKLLKLGISVGRTPERQEVLDMLQDDTVNGLFFITHELLAVLHKIKASLIIVDENIEESLTKTYKITMAQLSTILPYISEENQQNLLTYIQYFNSKERGEVLNTQGLEFILDDLRKNHLEDYLSSAGIDQLPPALFSIVYNEVRKSETKTFGGSVPCIRLLRHSPLIEYARANRIPIKLLTATPLHQRLINYYGEDFDIIKAPLAANTGEVIFYRGYTGAKGNGCDRVPRMIKYIKQSLTQEQIDNSIVITFKDAVDQFEAAGFKAAFVEDSETYVHLRNNAGLDQFKGKDIIVAGKFELPDECYLDIADDLKIENPKKNNTAIMHNGIKQTLFLWQEPQLQNEQLQYLEFITSQAIGRARALREDATVYVFSNYITLDADKVYD